MHYPSPLFLIPSALATAFYTSEGVQALRLLAIGVFIDALIPSTSVVLLFAAAAISQTISASSSTVFEKFDFFAFVGVIQTILGYAATCAVIVLKNQKKPSIHVFFLACTLVSLSVTIAVSYLSVYFFGTAAPYFAAVAMSSGRLILELMLQQNVETYDNDKYGPGFGVEQVNGGQQLTHGLSYFQTLRKRTVVTFGIVFAVCAVVIPIIFNYFGNYYGGLLGYLQIVLLSTSILFGVTFLLWAVMNKKKLRNIGLKEEKIVKTTDEKERSGAQDDVKGFKKVLIDAKMLFTVQKRDLVWFAGLCIVYQLLNHVFYGQYVQEYYNYILTTVFSWVSTKAILNNSATLNTLLMILSPTLTLNQPLSLFIHFVIHCLLNFTEQLSFSTLFMLTAEAGCICFSSVDDKWIFTIVFAFLAMFTQITSFESSKLGVKVIIFIHSLILDLLITLPKNYLKNIIVNGLVMIAMIVYNQRFMTTAVGEKQANQIMTSILLRLIVNTLNGFLLTQGMSYETYEIIKIIVKWNGYFISTLSLLMQILSYFNLGERVSKWRYLLLGPLFIGITAIVTLTPLNVIITDIVLFITGFSNIFTVTSTQVLQEISILVYRAFFEQYSKSLGVTVLIWLCKLLSGLFIASIVLLVMDKKDKNQLEPQNLLVSVFFASLLSLFVAVPSAISQLGELDEFSLINCAVIILVFIGVAMLPVVNLEAKSLKIVFSLVFIALIIFSFVTQLYSEGFVLMIFLILLQALPQTSIVFSFLVSILFLIIFINTRYSLVTISYYSAISTFSLISVLFFTRYQFVKLSALRRLTKRAKVEHAGCKVNPRAFGIHDDELDFFLQLNEDQEKVDANVVFKSLNWQMQTFIFVSSAVLFSWNFYPLIGVLLSLCSTLIPVHQEDQDGKITKVAGYFGVLEGWQVTQQNKFVMINRFCFDLFVLLNFKVLMDIINFFALYMGDHDGYEAGRKYAARDVLCWIFEGLCSFIGYVYITGEPTKIFQKIIELQRVKILVILTVVSVTISLFATNKALKLLPTFCAAGIAFCAPATKGAEGSGKRVVHVEPVDL
ncbi:Conserved_hypothetical protein [Hexamita inflata]|uniref:Uncharacterized protein n=1 Tax=Hexamita inflata TaxID=28002 RepID=A0AA86PK88_9EUKA|nr:Conserved hypothetical protein [Hexamita inflata]